MCNALRENRRATRTKVSGGYIGGVTPVPIPNTEVKPSRADGTPRETVWESRSLPDFFIHRKAGGILKKIPSAFCLCCSIPELALVARAVLKRRIEMGRRRNQELIQKLKIPWSVRPN